LWQCTHAGKEKNILDLLRSTTDPTGPFVVSSRPYLHGKRSGTALPFCHKLQILLMLGPHLCFVVGNMMLHHPATFPMGAIAPVAFLWRPLPNPSSDHTDVRRQLWVWVHPSASAELLQAFHKVASQHEGKAALALCAWRMPSSSQPLCFIVSTVIWTSLKDELVRFELTGPHSHTILTSTLRLAPGGASSGIVAYLPSLRR
jgi:ribonuclease P/MRP protein subunit POP1